MENRTFSNSANENKDNTFYGLDEETQGAIVYDLALFLKITCDEAESIAKTLYYKSWHNCGELRVEYEIPAVIERKFLY